MKEINKIHYSINSNKCSGTCSPHGNICLYLDAILIDAKNHHKRKNYEKAFVAYLINTEFHEIGHAFSDWGGCDDFHACCNKACFWCNITDNLRSFFYKNTRSL